jgi:hypothetical protein
LLNCLGEPADRIVALRVLGVEIDAELQCSLLEILHAENVLVVDEAGSVAAGLFSPL